MAELSLSGLTIAPVKRGLLWDKTFWADESDAPILLLNKRFLNAETDCSELEQRALRWLEHAELSASDVEEKRRDFIKFAQKFTAAKTVPDRIFVRDAERAFCSTKNQTLLIHVLSYLQEQFGGYHQGKNCFFIPPSM